MSGCGWCGHPLGDASPSPDFCSERCAADWRLGLDWYPEERCGCRTCDSGWWARVVGPMDEPPRRVAPAHAETPPPGSPGRGRFG